MQVSMPADPSAKQTPGRNPSSAGVNVSENLFTLTGHGASMTSIVRWISMQLGSTVIDKTGLTEKYDYTLSFVPDDSMKAGILPPGSGGGAPPPESEGPSIFTALQEQLGLKLVAAETTGGCDRDRPHGTADGELRRNREQVELKKGRCIESDISFVLWRRLWRSRPVLLRRRRRVKRPMRRQKCRGLRSLPFA